MRQVDRPSAEIERFGVLRQRWVDLRGDIDDLYLVEKDKESKAKGADDLKSVSEDLVTALRVIEQARSGLTTTRKSLSLTRSVGVKSKRKKPSAAGARKSGRQPI